MENRNIINKRSETSFEVYKYEYLANTLLIATLKHEQKQQTRGGKKKTSNSIGHGK